MRVLGRDPEWGNVLRLSTRAASTHPQRVEGSASIVGTVDSHC